MVNKPTIWQRLFRLEDSPKPVENGGPKTVIVHNDPIGSSGIENFSGYFQEEYLSKLHGRQRADEFDKMRRSDPKIKMLLSAVKNPIKAGKWDVEAADDSPEAEKMAELVEHILFKDIGKPFTAFLHEALSFIDQGFVVFEITDKIVVNHPKFGSYNGIRQIGFRSQRTIERFNLDHATGDLISVSQYAYGDLQRQVEIPAQFLMVMSMDKEGDNYEGISWLRPCYGPWKRKDHHLKAEAIGIEKYAIPTPILKVPPNKEKGEEFDNAVNVVRRYVTHQQQYISLPDGWAIDFLKTDFDSEKIRASINAENVEMVHAFLANFLELGNNTSSGSFALSFDLSDFFLGGIQYIANLICEHVNSTLVKRIVDLNFGPQEEYPQLKVSGITDKAGKELSEVIKNLVDSKVIIPDDNLEEDMRERYELSKKSDVGQREVQPAQNNFQPQPTVQRAMSETVRFEEPKKQIKTDKEVLKGIMQENLAKVSSGMVDQLMKSYRNLSPSQRVSATKDLSPSGLNAYKQELLQALAEISASALEQARREVPKAKNIKLSENLKAIKLGEFESLPPDIQKRLKAQSDLIVGTQIADLEKNLSFRYQSSIGSTDSESLIESDLNEAGAVFIEGASVEVGAANFAAQAVNEARNAFFFDDQVLEEIESFTFVNGDPVSPICQDLAGTVFAKDDPNMDRYMPPLHHNCKSFIVPNLVSNSGKNPELTDGGLKPSKSSLEKYVTLSENRCSVLKHSH